MSGIDKISAGFSMIIFESNYFYLVKYFVNESTLFLYS
jgi:hypothetical protein